MKKNYLLALAILLLIFVFSACDSDQPLREVIENDTEENEEVMGDEVEDSENAEDTTEEADIVPEDEAYELIAEEIFEVVSMPLYMEGTLTEDDYTVEAYLYLTEQYLRAEIHDYDFVPIAVFNLVDDSAFLYVESKKLGAYYDEFEIYEFLHYQDFIDENIEFVENMEETTMNGYDVVYGEVEYEGDVMKFWYSREYDVPIKIELNTVEGTYSAMNVTKVEILTDADPSLFERPINVMFVNLDDEDLDLEEVIYYLD